MTRDWRADAWRQVQEGILVGLVHDLNGRVSALDGLMRILGDGVPEPDLMDMLRHEVTRLDETVRLVRGMPRRTRREEAEALVVGEVAEEAARLVRSDQQVGAVRMGESPAAVVRARHDELLELILLLVAAHRSPVMAIDVPEGVRLSWQVGGGQVHMRAVAPVDWPPITGILDAAHRLAARMGGQADADSDGRVNWIRASLPLL